MLRKHVLFIGLSLGEFPGWLITISSLLTSLHAFDIFWRYFAKWVEFVFFPLIFTRDQDIFIRHYKLCQIIRTTWFDDRWYGGGCVCGSVPDERVMVVWIQRDVADNKYRYKNILHPKKSQSCESNYNVNNADRLS